MQHVAAAGGPQQPHQFPGGYVQLQPGQLPGHFAAPHPAPAPFQPGPGAPAQFQQPYQYPGYGPPPPQQQGYQVRHFRVMETLGNSFLSFQEQTAK